MDKKRLFPGVTQDALDKQQRAAAANANAAEEKLQAAKDAAERKSLIEAQGVNWETFLKERRQAMWRALWWIPIGFCTWFSLGIMANGFFDAIVLDKETYGDEWSKTVVNPFVDGKFKPTGTWYRQIAALMVTIIFAMIEWQASNERYRDDKKTIRAVDMMSRLKKLGEKYNLNTYQVGRLVKLAPDVISSMSAKDRTYFDMFMNGQISIKNKKTELAFAENVMMGHLLSHPKDAVKIWECFDEKTIPYALAQRCKMYMEAGK